MTVSTYTLVRINVLVIACIFLYLLYNGLQTERPKEIMLTYLWNQHCLFSNPTGLKYDEPWVTRLQLNKLNSGGKSQLTILPMETLWWLGVQWLEQVNTTQCKISLTFQSQNPPNFKVVKMVLYLWPIMWFHTKKSGQKWDLDIAFDWGVLLT